MQGINIDPDVLIHTQGNIIGQQAKHIAQLEAAVQQLGMEKEQLLAQIPKDKEVTKDAATGTDE